MRGAAGCGIVSKRRDQQKNLRSFQIWSQNSFRSKVTSVPKISTSAKKFVLEKVDSCGWLAVLYGY